ncbi:hypothetical protein BH09PSE5_BH09PSE5_17480 [soil metagenome]
MSEPVAPRTVSTDAAADQPLGARTAGQILRMARQAQGMHVAALAAAIKVTPQKLEALENERFDLLPDPTFARALALAVCRYLKIDPDPVMSRLPQPREHRLEHINRGLATPFRDRPDRQEQSDFGDLFRPALVAPFLVLVAAFVIYVVPTGMWSVPSFVSNMLSPSSGAGSATAIGNAPSQAPTASSGATEATDSSIVVETVHSAPTQALPITAPASASATTTSAAAPSVDAGSPLTIRASSESWVEVVDSQGRVLVSRMLPAGETVGLDGPAPLKLRIGNAEGTQVTFKGQAVSLAGATKDNVARLELK